MISSGILIGAVIGSGLAIAVVVKILAFCFGRKRCREEYEQGSNKLLFSAESRFSPASMKDSVNKRNEENSPQAQKKKTKNHRNLLIDPKIEDDKSSKPFILSTPNPVQFFIDRCLKLQRRSSNYAIHHRPSAGEFNALAKEQHLAVQPSSTLGTTVVESTEIESGGSSLVQPRVSIASGNVQPGSTSRSLTRNPSISSQGSLDGSGSPNSGHQANRVPSSPRIRAFGPDGRHRQPDSFPSAYSYPPRNSRSPSPARAVSLDARCASPASFAASVGCGTASPSQCSLSSLTTPGATSSCGSSFGTARSRCLSPLLIPPPTSSLGDGSSPAPPASPLGSLQPDLYQRQDGPLFLSADNTGGKSMGRLHLRLKYDFDKSDLRVHLIEAHDLAGSDQGGFNDPYVKLTLSPEVDTRKRQTPIHRNNPNPFFDQHFKFPISHDQLQEATLILQVFDYDRFSRNDVVGSVRITMDELEFVGDSSSIEIWGEIAREKKPPEEIQQVLVSLSYLPSAERLTVLILKARNLFPSQEDKEILDPFVKVSLLTGDKRVKKKKTSVRKATRCPVWNEAMSFNVAAASLAASAIEVCVFDSSSELIGGNAILGSCIVGPATGASSENESDATNRSREHWLHMTTTPRKAISMWHTLH